jgi:hypothetical protein
VDIFDTFNTFVDDSPMITTPSGDGSEFPLDLDTMFPAGSQEIQLPQPTDHCNAYYNIDKETNDVFNNFLEQFPAPSPSTHSQ